MTSTQQAQSTTTGNGNVVRRWVDDTVIHIQLTTHNGVELGQVRFEGRDAEALAAIVAIHWVEANK